MIKKKNLFVFEVSSKKNIVLISIKNNLKTSDIENLGAEFYGRLNNGKNKEYNIISDSITTKQDNFLGYFLHRHHTIPTEIPFSPLFGNLKIGSNYLSHYDLPHLPPPNGEVDDINHFSGPNFDPTILSPSVKHFYEQTFIY